MNPVISALRQQTLDAARNFADYNFRHYFVKHTEDFFQPFVTAEGHPKKSQEETDKFVVDATAYLKQMQRMSIVNSMYAEQACLSGQGEAEEEDGKAVPRTVFLLLPDLEPCRAHTHTKILGGEIFTPIFFRVPPPSGLYSHHPSKNVSRWTVFWTTRALCDYEVEKSIPDTTGAV